MIFENSNRIRFFISKSRIVDNDSLEPIRLFIQNSIQLNFVKDRKIQMKKFDSGFKASFERHNFWKIFDLKLLNSHIFLSLRLVIWAVTTREKKIKSSTLYMYFYSYLKYFFLTPEHKSIYTPVRM